jgi:hypothetical protein
MCGGGRTEARSETGSLENRKTGKPENRKTGKPENRKTGKPENRKTGKPENRKTGALLACIVKRFHGLALRKPVGPCQPSITIQPP